MPDKTEKKVARVTIKEIIIGDDRYLAPPSIQGYREIFAKHGVTHIIQFFGMVNHLYGDQPDGEYEIKEWLEWLDNLI
jgi:hypothetical protein